jgi:hypothetical protein
MKHVCFSCELFVSFAAIVIGYLTCNTIIPLRLERYEQGYDPNVILKLLEMMNERVDLVDATKAEIAAAIEDLRAMS